MKNIGASVFISSGYKAIVSGVYSNTTSRYIEIAIREVTEPSEGAYGLPNMPFAEVNVMAAVGSWFRAAVTKSRVNPSNSDQLLITLDRGWSYERSGSAQPDTYTAPINGGLIVWAGVPAAAREASSWAKAANTVLYGTIKNTTGGIVKDFADEFVVAAKSPESLTVAVGSGALITALGAEYSEDQDFILVPGFAAQGETGFKKMARLYLDSISAEVKAVYGAASESFTATFNSYSAIHAVNNTITAESAKALVAGRRVWFSGTLTGTALEASTDYYIKAITGTGTALDPYVFTIALTPTGDAVDLTAAEDPGATITLTTKAA